MRISDWSSDVCSSDLQLLQGAPRLMVKAIRIHEPGGPEVLRYEDVAVPAPGPGEVLLQQKACGLNYIDVYHRMGTYPLQYPDVLGLEGMGVVEAVGAAVRADRTRVVEGKRVDVRVGS